MTNNEKWQTRWINPNAKAFYSKIHGLGLKSIAPIGKGEIVAVLGGIIVPVEDIEHYRKGMQHIGIQINDRFFICPKNRKEVEGLGAFNHSCEPNVGLSDSITFIAIRDIDADEELTTDYAFVETRFEEFGCECGSDNCRKRITPLDWQKPEIQKKYGRYFSPYLRAKSIHIG